MEKSENNILESFVACDLKVGRYRHVKLQVIEYSWSRQFLDLGRRSFTY